MASEYESYFSLLEHEADLVYQLAKRARERGLDPSFDVEVPRAKDMASRVESLVGPPGVAELIRKLDKSGLQREVVSLKVAERICHGDFGEMSIEESAEQAVRTSLAILTEGIVSAPLEGIASIKVKHNPDGTKYLAIYFAGPIRSAGGTAAAMAVLITDYVRQKLHLDGYKVMADEIERFYEEVQLYDRNVRLQYKPSYEDVKAALEHITVEVTGETTDKIEVTGYRDLERIETNCLRGGAMLALCEGVLQKASKILKITDKASIGGWEWLKDVGKSKKSAKEGSGEIAPNWKYLNDIIAGRPIFSHPMARGGFRIRYGRSRNTGLAGWGIHPATMYVLDSFLAIGTQMKTERPGKANVTAPVDSVEGPIVKLRDGTVMRVESSDQAKEINDKIDEILFLGDAVIGVGEFLENNHVLLPSGYVEEWWVQELEAADTKGEFSRYVENPFDIGERDALAISRSCGIPLHPRFTYHWGDIDLEELKDLVEWCSEGRIEDGRLVLRRDDRKRLLERICVPHAVSGDTISIASETFRLCVDKERFDDVIPLISPEGKGEQELVHETVGKVLGIAVRPKCPVTVGGRMGRPEKAKERTMSPPVHGLFPVGPSGGKTRSLVKAMDNNYLRVEVANRYCRQCNTVHYTALCPTCKEPTIPYAVCNNKRCKMANNKTFEVSSETCPGCRGRLSKYSYKNIDIRSEMQGAIERMGIDMPKEVKGVIGMTSEEKFPERVDKAILRARNGVYVFKDGTMRYDATDVPLTHVQPREINTSVDRMHELGYLHDADGRKLTSPDQVVELRVQDIVLADTAADYILRCCTFLDELLEKFYGLPAFYNAKEPDDLVGHLVIGLAPHTSAGVLGRIIGYTKARVGYAHPFFHAAKRRNCDGDEDAILLLLDALLNFSRRFLPANRGGKMDAPLVMTTRIDPLEIDKEAHNLDTSRRYPLTFYQKTQEYAHPSELGIPTVADRLGTEEALWHLDYSLPTRDIADGPEASAYKTLGSMSEKIEAQLEIARKVRAVDLDDTAQRVIISHFIPDLIGNLRSFSKQTFRCVNCNAIYRRVPLSGKCTKCYGGRLVLTVSKGSVEKYLQVTKDIIRNYEIDPYISQRIAIIEKELESVFREKTKQMSLADFAP
ncbi:DNA polymerase II large subunit [archaeon]|nr:MAG: DNA polymerase II large subunit [archaeon]